MMDHFFQEISENIKKEGDLSKLLYDIPPEMNEVLLLEEESIKKFTKHIEGQKSNSENFFNKLILEFTHFCYQSKKRMHDNLDKQLQTFRSNHDYLRRKLVTFYPKNLSESQIANKDIIVKEFQKATSYLEIESLIKQIQNDLDEIKTFKANDPSTNYESLRQIALAVRKQAEQLPSVECSILGDKEALQSILSKALTPIFNDLLTVHNEMKEVSLNLIKQIDTVFKLDRSSLDFLRTLVAITAPSPKFRLLYRGSRDGYTAKAFHQKCDNQGPTLVLVESNHGKIFGGFADAPWTSKGIYATSDNNFLFSLDEQSYYPVKAAQRQWAQYCTASYGPTFGGGHDLFIADNCNYNNSSMSLGLTYESRNHAASKITGGTSFTVKEIEVFAVEASEAVPKPEVFQPELMAKEDYNMVRKWVEPLKPIKLNLIYKATKHGFDCRDFHKHCDGKKNTVVVVRANKRVFGGYTTQAWDTTSQFAVDDQAFLFSVTDKKKFGVIKPDQAIFKYEEAGPAFGGGYDIFICSNCNILKESHSHFGFSYDATGVSKPESYFAGEKSFIVDEIEVFTVEK